jgi:tetratricopeptide (TPR) repeat protein
VLNPTPHPLDESIAEYREAIRLKMDDADPHNNLGVALGNKGLLDEAIAEFREAIRLKKDLPEAHINLGNALQDKGLLDESISECREAIRLKRDAPVEAWVGYLQLIAPYDGVVTARNANTWDFAFTHYLSQAIHNALQPTATQKKAYQHGRDS